MSGFPSFFGLGLEDSYSNFWLLLHLDTQSLPFSVFSPSGYVTLNNPWPRAVGVPFRGATTAEPLCWNVSQPGPLLGWTISLTCRSKLQERRSCRALLVRVRRNLENNTEHAAPSTSPRHQPVFQVTASGQNFCKISLWIQRYDGLHSFNGAGPFMKCLLRLQYKRRLQYKLGELSRRLCRSVHEIQRSVPSLL